MVPRRPSGLRNPAVPLIEPDHQSGDEAEAPQIRASTLRPFRPEEELEGRSAGEDDVLQPAVRWRVARSAALVFLGMALAIGAALFLVRSSEPSAAAVSVQLDAEQQGADPSGTSPSEAGEEPLGPDAMDSDTTSTTASSGGLPEEVVVYVTGAVVSPGVVTVTPGTRLFEVLERVGGPSPEADLEGINLAGAPSDGQHIHVLALGEEPRPISEPLDPGLSSYGGTPAAPGGTTGGTGSESGTGGLLDINSASLTEIESLPRVGPVLGQRIIDWRDEHGPFAQPSDIDAVPGIGPALLEGILPLIATG